MLAILALGFTLTLAERSPVFIETDVVERMIDYKEFADIKIFDCSVRSASDDLLNYHQNHIATAKFIDLNYFRNMSSKYAFMLPDEKQFIDMMKLYAIKKTTRVILYDTGNSYYATRV
jgi:3-mercaptopyruvate sulfurtransferase SseA